MNKPFSKRLIVMGWVVALPSAALALRLVWEQTLLTWSSGPQMVGFSLAHSGLMLPLLLGIIGGVIWLSVYLVLAIRRRTIGSRSILSPVTILIISVIVVSIPYGSWQWAFAAKLAESPRAPDFLIYASAKGDFNTVKSLVARGVAIDIRNSEGKTALHSASVAGELEIAKYLVDNGADLNAISRWGDSPLEGAISEGHNDVAEYLISHGAMRIAGTEEQRDRASSEIVREQMEEMEERLRLRNDD